MKAWIGTLVPPMLVLATAGWAAWPYLESPGPSPISRARGVEVSSASLARVPGRPPGRDPFRSPIVLAAVKSARAPKSGPGEKVPKAGLVDAILEARRAEVDFRAALPGKVSLSATSSHSARRMAVLNGRVYFEGESIRGIDAPGPVVLAAVRPASVGLSYGGKNVEIAFPPSSATTRPPPSITRSSPSPPGQNRKKGVASRSNVVRKPSRPR